MTERGVERAPAILTLPNPCDRLGLLDALGLPNQERRRARGQWPRPVEGARRCERAFNASEDWILIRSRRDSDGRLASDPVVPRVGSAQHLLIEVRPVSQAFRQPLPRKEREGVA